MTQVIGNKYLSKSNYQKDCNKCGAIIVFDNSDIIRDDMGCEIICPNCGNSIKF